MEAGVALDLLVAEHVFGWQWQEIPRHIHIVGGDAMRDEKVLMPPNADFPPHSVGQGTLFYHAAVPAYSTIMKDGWTIIEKYMKLSRVSMEYLPYAGWNIDFVVNHDDTDSSRSIEAHASGGFFLPTVCETALKAVGYVETPRT